ncbi:MAG: hypothetical protein R6X29_04785 [Acidimicrobiia bacterium]
MHEHDLDLVADLAAGDPAGDVAATRELVRTCAECRGEYEMQLRVHHALAGLPSVAMTAAERTRLQDGVVAALPASAGPAASPATRSRIPRWWRVVPVAAAAAVVLAVGGLTGGLGGGDTADLAAEDAVGGSADVDERAGVAGAPEMAEPTTTTAAAADGAERMSASEVESVQVLMAILLEDPPTATFAAEEFQCGSSTTRPATSGVAGIVDGVGVEVFLVEAEAGGEPALEAFTLPGCEPLQLPPADDR